MAVGENGLAGLIGKTQITAQDVLAVRAAIYPDMTVSPDEAETLFAINDAAHATCPEWRMLFVEALTDYVVHQQQPRDYVDHTKAEWVMARISRDGKIKTDTELELLIHILEMAAQAPAELAKFALHQVAASALTPERRAGDGHTLTAEEVSRLRRVFYAQAGEGGGAAISRDEAALLFILNAAAKGRPNDPSWRELFVHGVGGALMAAPGYLSPDRATELRRERWLETPSPDLGALLGKVLQDSLNPSAALAETRDGSDVQTDALASQAAMNAVAAPITEEEARWLIGQIGRDGELDDNEVALLLFIAQTADSIDPALEPLIAQAKSRQPEGAKAPAADKPVTFGHRGAA